MNSTPSTKNPMDKTIAEHRLEALGELLSRSETATVEGNYAYDHGSVWEVRDGGWWVNDYLTRLVNAQRATR